MIRTLATVQGFMAGALFGLIVGTTLGSTDALLVRPDEVAAAELRGVASWFRSPSDVSAAGPALREALGPDWRGMRVRVCTTDRCAVTVLGDWMRADRLIDLDDDTFAVLAPLSVGLLRVTVAPVAIPAIPDTSTEGSTVRRPERRITVACEGGYRQHHQLGVEEDARMARLGHSTTDMARRYARASEVIDRAAADRLGEAIG